MLASLAIPSFANLQLRSRMGEAKVNLAAIRTGEEAYLVQSGTYLPAPVAPGGGLGSNKRPWNAVSPGFDELGWTPEGLVYFDYMVWAPAGCPGAGVTCNLYTAEAFSDLDVHGNLSAWGYVHMPPGNTSGVAGLACLATGVYDPGTGAQDLTNSVGPCRVTDRSTF